jgi:hypothetical protein
MPKTFVADVIERELDQLIGELDALVLSGGFTFAAGRPQVSILGPVDPALQNRKFRLSTPSRQSRTKNSG